MLDSSIRFMKILAASLLASFSLSAATVTFGSGSSVTTADRTATFNSITTGTNLSNYSENNLSVTIDTSAYGDFIPGQGFSGGFFYPSGGFTAPTIIRGTDWALFSGLEFTLGTGYVAQSGATTFVAWETRRGGSVTDSGWFTADLSNQVIVGFSDLLGFDELHVANYDNLAQIQAGIGGQVNGLALDNLKVALYNDSPVPEPGTTGLLAGGLFALAAVSRRARKSTTI